MEEVNVSTGELWRITVNSFENTWSEGGHPWTVVDTNKFSAASVTLRLLSRWGGYWIGKDGEESDVESTV
jgi:hypothetical protein